MAGPTPTSDAPLTRWLRDHAVAVAGVAVAAVVAAGGLGLAFAGRDTPGEAAPDTAGSPPEGSLSLIAVKVDNAPAARPQIGLGAARYVVEVPVEGGLTRFLALFEPGDALVGPVRSARPVDVDLVPAFTDVLVSTGGRPFVLGPLTGNGITLVGAEAESSPLQSLERPMPHNQFVSLADVPAPDATGEGMPGTPWPEGSSEQIGPLEVPYPAPVGWTFEDGLYVRSEDGEAAAVFPEWGAEPQPLTAETVVVMAVNQRSAGYRDVNGAEVPTFDVIGSDRVWVHHGGEVVSGRWQRSSADDGYLFHTHDGSPFGPPAGRTFIHLVPRHLLTE